MISQVIELRLTQPDRRKILLEYLAPENHVPSLVYTHKHFLERRREPQIWVEKNNGFLLDVEEACQIGSTSNGGYRIQCPAGTADRLWKILPFGTLGRRSETILVIEFEPQYTYTDWFQEISPPSPIVRSAGLRKRSRLR